MYINYWGLSEKPFENTTDPRFLYNSNQHYQALAKLMYIITERKGAGVLTGTFGCGKTVIGRAILKELDKNSYRSAYITNPQLTEIELLKVIAYHLGIVSIEPSKSDILKMVEELLVNNHRDGKHTVIIIDEAHVIEDVKVFEELRMLLNLQDDYNFLLTLILIGQPELLQKIENIKQLDQRISIKCQLTNLSREDTGEYIIHRLNIVSRREPIFTSEAIDFIYQQSAGIPRRINQICDISLFTGFVRKATTIGPEIVQEAIEGTGIFAPEETTAGAKVSKSIPVWGGEKPYPLSGSGAGVSPVISTPPHVGISHAKELEKSKELYDYMLLLLENIFNRVERGEDIDLATIVSTIKNAVDDLNANDILIFLTNRTSNYNYLYSHSVNGCILAIKMGMGLGYDKNRLLDLGVSALLRDVGMADVSSLIKQIRKLTDEEYSKVKRHVVQSAIILDEIKGIEKHILDAIRQHHERLDGNGYPAGLSNGDISESARIIGLADTYEALVHPRSYRDKITPDNAMKTIANLSGTSFEPYIVKIFIDELSFYPVGCFVRLSTDEIGVVTAVHKGSPTTPMIKVLFNQSGEPVKDDRTLDLKKEANIFVEKILWEEEVPRVE